ncbi:hypothetical protein AVEN_55999-1 [Araneus ventricosus]|uniref:Uncharacterized protein n=1 Tax=Araneus ventricosus TaxID=182803 RepID=A0A4Y2TJ05_ARAVE|nr:hypothetical protein AVEN_55999-1 [Araneus ventricosus]
MQLWWYLTALHHATECVLTVSRHMRRPAPNLEQEWLKRGANNLVSRQKIRRMVKFINENRDIFRSFYFNFPASSSNKLQMTRLPPRERKEKQHLKKRTLILLQKCDIAFLPC